MNIEATMKKELKRLKKLKNSVLGDEKVINISSLKLLKGTRRTIAYLVDYLSILESQKLKPKGEM